ncbi:MAG: TIGR02186 family protein [Pseudomonadota bacterium]
MSAMRQMFAALLVLAAIAVGRAPALATPDLEERIFTGSAQEEVAITATFSGSELFVFGAIERNRFLDQGEASPDVIISVRGPSSPVIVRKKGRVAGVWMNKEAIRIASAPSYYAVASTGAIPDILDDFEDRTFRITLDKAVLIAGLPTSAEDPAAFREALMRLRQEEGLYRETPFGVLLKSGTLFQTRLSLPANIIEGDYQVRVFLLREGKVLDQARITIPVRKRGVERVVFAAAQETPILYSLLTLAVALLAGWGAAELFRRLSR